MKILLLLFMLSPLTVFATQTEGDSRGHDTIHYYHGKAMKSPVSGAHSESLVSLVVRKSSDHASWLIYRVLDNHQDSTFILHIRKQHNLSTRCAPPNTNNSSEMGCASMGPEFVKVYVPGEGQSLTNIDEHNVTSLNMMEAGWGHFHQHRGHHGYTKLSYFLNYEYPGVGHVDANVFVKAHDSGKRHMYGKYGVSNAEEGLQYVWTDKMKLVFTAP